MIVYQIILFLAAFLGFRYLKLLRFPGIPSWWGSFAFALKVLVGFYFLYIYTAIYGNGSLSADAGAFMTESKLLNDVFYTSPVDYFKLIVGIGDQQPIVLEHLGETSHWASGAQTILSDNRNVLRIHSLIHFISGGQSSVHLMIMCVVSLLGLKHLYLAICHKRILNPKVVFLILMLFPSLLFWSSSVLKEPLMFLGFGLFLHGVVRPNWDLKTWFLLIFGGFLLLAFKPYVLICLIPAIGFTLLYRVIPKHKLAASVGVLALVLLGGIILLPSARNKMVKVLSRKQYDFKNVGKGGLHAQSDTCFYFFQPEQVDLLTIEGDSVYITQEMDVVINQHGSTKEPQKVHLVPNGEKWLLYYTNVRSEGYIEMTMIDNSFLQLVKNIPEALINSLLRPFITDPGSWLKFPAMLESMLLFLFLLYSLLHRKKLDDQEKSVIYGILLFAILLALLIGWVTPVLGAIVRYRIPVYLGILIISLIIIKPSKLKRNG